jgi:hypothetical protein
MLPDTGEKKPAHAAMKTMNLFWFLVKTEWIGVATDALEAIGSIESS